MQILYNKNSEYNKKYMHINIGKSKGLEYSNVIIYPSGPMKKILNENTDLKEREKSKLYVALTRSIKDVYIVN